MACQKYSGWTSQWHIRRVRRLANYCGFPTKPNPRTCVRTSGRFYWFSNEISTRFKPPTKPMKGLRKLRIDAQIAELRQMLTGTPTATAATPEVPRGKRRKMSAAARKRMGDAQR